ncbi:MAG: AbrB/MazE/SpoVT family DNA-binding domain-containing protein [Planctomycetes bacterium]|nr:AbrB/MazE/SpoVT family DNA-binding domain-containing protein [Planctomycetota bacterium]
MSDAMPDAMTVKMDRAGRVVLPKAVREEAGFVPGAPLRIRVRDGRVEIEAAPLRYRIVMHRGFKVAEALDPVPPLTAEEVRRLTRSLRERRTE